MLELGAVITYSEPFLPRLQAVQRAGYRFVQLDITSPTAARNIETALTACRTAKLSVEALGCYANPLQTTSSLANGVNADDLRAMLEALPARREDEDAYRIVCWSGTLSGKLLLPHPGNTMPGATAELLGWTRELLPLLEAKNACLLFHPHHAHTLGSHHALHRFLQTLDSAYVGAVLDFCNILNPRNFHERDTLLIEILKKLSPYTGLVHLRDARIETFSIAVSGPGQGQLGYAGMLQQLRRHVADVPWFVAGVEAELQLQRAREFVELQNRI